MGRGDGGDSTGQNNGAGNGIRTRDPQLGRLMLYQLSYSRVCRQRWWGRVDLNHCRRKPAGLQPAPFDRSGTPPRISGSAPLDSGDTLKFNTERERMVLVMGLEPATDGLQNRCSTN